jgi:type VI protein secretion system component VasK
MGKIVYDFREGLDQEKIVYKSSGWDWSAICGYGGYLILTWIWACGFFALFQYAYINHEPVAFWVYIGIWLAFVALLLTVIIYNLGTYYSNKALKKKLREEEELKKADKDRREREEMKKREENKLMNEVVTTRHNENDKLNQ